MADTILTGLTELSVPALGDWVYQVDVSDTTDDAAGSSRKLTNERLAGFFNPAVCNGRLTLESGVPVSTSDQTAKTSVFFTPYNGNRIAVYDGTRWKLYPLSELTLALGTLTADKNYDILIYDNAGTLTLELSAAWTNDTTRADALTTQDGVYVKSGATTRRYLGTIRTTATTTTEDSAAKRFVWNAYNQQHRRMSVKETTASWTYSTATWRQVRAQTTNQVAAVIGLSGPAVWLDAWAIVSSTSAGHDVPTGIGLDSTSAPAANCWGMQGQSQGAQAVFPVAFYRDVLALGYHYFAWIERGVGSGTQTWFGEDATPIRRSGLNGFVEG